MKRIFISYSHDDEGLRQELDKHLMSLKRQGLIEVWNDRRILAGDELDPTINEELFRADIILLLISPSFIASRYCYDIEMREALRRHEAGEARVIPVILRACDWQHLPIGALRATPNDGIAVRMHQDLDTAFLQVIKDIRSAIEVDKGSEKKGSLVSATAFHETANATPGHVAASARSGNLMVKKEFTDYDRDKFRADAFEFIARFFENSLNELAVRNTGFRSDFRRVDAKAFECYLYDQAGCRRSGCGIWMNDGRSGFGEISYSTSGLGNRNSYNESFSVSDNGISQGLKAMGMLSAMAGKGDALLTEEGAAETLWTSFIEPLQR